MNKFFQLSIAAMAAIQSRGLANAEEPPEDVSSFYNPTEERGSFDFVMKPYEIPIETTTYVDFFFNIPDELPDLFHVVMGEVINSQPLHLHHFVLTGCPEKIDPAMEGLPVDFDLNTLPECFVPLGGWAPGADIFGNIDLDTGVLMGKGLGIQAVQLNVHYTDGAYEDPETMTKKIATDGIRVHYTPDFRPYTSSAKPLINIGFAGREMQVPPGESRFYVTKTCKVNTSCKDTTPQQLQDVVAFLGLGAEQAAAIPDDLSCPTIKPFCNMGGDIGSFIQQLCPVSCGFCDKTEGKVNPLNPEGYRVTGINYHAHLLGREMYATLLRENETVDPTIDIQRSAPTDASNMMVKDLKSAEFWIYDFQETYPMDFEDIIAADGTNEILRGTEVKAGDKIQVTCVYDSTYRDESTSFGLSTYDEMCITSTIVTFETPPSLLALDNTSDTDLSNIDLRAELNLMVFTCDSDEETDIYTGVLEAGEDGRDIWKDHPISEAEGCTFPNNEFSAGIFETRNCPDTAKTESNVCGDVGMVMLANENAGASCQGGDHNERDANDGLTESECIEGGGQYYPYTCGDIDYFIKYEAEANGLSGEILEYLIQYWWAPKCCGDAPVETSASSSEDESNTDADADVDTLVSNAESAASGMAKGSMTLALLSALAAMIV